MKNLSNSKQKILTTDNFKPITDAELMKLADDIYDDVYENEILINDMKNILNQDVLEYSNTDRQTPKYAPGFLDKPFIEGGIPIRPKDLSVYNAIMSENYGIVEIEGGVRGGKDVIALLAVSRKEMVAPDPFGLVLGSSLEHALRTVLLAGGFGLFYTIPHGVFIRESINGAQRGVYKFLDAYGIEKNILFYGNEKENDGNKFQGFNGIGLVYVNETLNQHINGLEQGINRLSSAKSPLMVTTQNPKGETADFYQKFEKPKTTGDYNIGMMEFIRDNYKVAFDKVEAKILKDRDEEKSKELKLFCSKRGKGSYQTLTSKEQLQANQMLLDINYKYDKIIRSLTVQKFYPYVFEGDYLFNKSMKKVVNFVRGEANPNNIKNAYDFYYAHYTIDDNISLSDMQKNDFKNRRTKGTASYDQQVMGIRRSTEGAVYSAFSTENIFSGDITKFDWNDKVRMIVIDPGFAHPTGITDWAFDLNKGEGWCLQERLIDFNIEYQNRKELGSIYIEFLKIVRGAKQRGEPDYVVVDPSKPELITYLQNYGWSVYAADNTNWTTKREDKEISNEVTARELRGIPLVQTAIAKNKLHVHESCVELIKQIGSYTYVDADKSGKEKLPDLGDDLVVTIKYAWNTIGITPQLWTESDGENVDDEERMAGTESEEDSEWNMEREIADNFFGNDFQKDDDDDKDFFSTDFNFFN